MEGAGGTRILRVGVGCNREIPYKNPEANRRERESLEWTGKTWRSEKVLKMGGEDGECTADG